MLDLTTIGTRIADYRKEQGLTQAELADKLFVTHQAVSKWEQGKSLPTVDILLAITQLFHITIDQLLEHSDIKDTDYDRLFASYPRHVVLSTFLRSETQADTIDQLFYRLTKAERLQVINHLIYHKGNLEVHHLWPYLNNPERTYLLGAILSGTLDYDIRGIETKLTTAEQLLVRTKHQDGTYPYPLRTIHYSTKTTKRRKQ